MHAKRNKARRVVRRRTKNWKMPANTVYVGRPTVWGNPFIVGSELIGGEKLTAEKAVALYRQVRQRRFQRTRSQGVFAREKSGLLVSTRSALPCRRAARIGKLSLTVSEISKSEARMSKQIRMKSNLENAETVRFRMLCPLFENSVFGFRNFGRYFAWLAAVRASASMRSSAARLKNFPRRITPLIFAVLRMSASGSASSKTRSAIFPG